MLFSFDENILVYALAVFIFELLEILWQKGSSVLHIILHNYSILMARGSIVYMLMHVSFIFITYLAIVINNDIVWTIFIIKVIDLGYKFYLLGKLSNNQMKLDKNILQMLTADIGYLKYATCVAYPVGFLLIL